MLEEDGHLQEPVDALDLEFLERLPSPQRACWAWAGRPRRHSKPRPAEGISQTGRFGNLALDGSH